MFEIVREINLRRFHNDEIKLPYTVNIDFVKKLSQLRQELGDINQLKALFIQKRLIIIQLYYNKPK